MFKRPEELIMAVLAALWVVFTYFLASYFGAPAQTALLITALTVIWAALFLFYGNAATTAWSGRSSSACWWLAGGRLSIGLPSAALLPPNRLTTPSY